MKSLFCLLMLLNSAIGYAQEENKHIETDRPNEAEVPYLVPKRYIQLETGIRGEQFVVDYKTSSYSGSYHYIASSLPSLLVKYGVSDKLELRLQTSYLTWNFEPPITPTHLSGIPPVELGGKLALIKEHKWIPKTALLAKTGIPSFATGTFKAKHLSPTFRLLMENNLTSDISFTYNVGVSWDGYTNTPEWMYSFVWGADLTKHLNLFGEWYSFLQRGEPPNTTLDGGLEYFIGENLGIDICYGLGTKNLITIFPNSDPHPYFITLGASFRFK